MSLLRRGRFIYWITRDLSKKYTRFLVVGFFVGLVSTLLLGRVLPWALHVWFLPIERIGIVGEFSPTTLPNSIQEHISMGLTTLTDDGSTGPGLADTWESTDSGKTYIFYLKKNLLWHNGKPVVARDVNYNIKQVTFQVIDAQTLKVNLDEPYSPFPTLVSKPILQSGLRGFGPYKVTRVQLKGDKIETIRLVPVTSGTLPILEYHFFRTEIQAITAYKLGTIDSIEDITTPNELRQWGRTQVKEEIRYDRVLTLFFNLRDQLVGEKSLRQALGYAIPNGSDEEAFSPISKTSWAYSNKIRHYDFDLDHAKKIFPSAKIGTDSGTLTISTFPKYIAKAQEIANNWTNLGIPTIVKIENAFNPQFQIFLSEQDIPPDPDQYPFWHSKQTQTNITGYVNLKIDKLLEDGRREMDQTKRKKIYADFQRFLVEDAPVLFIDYPKIYTISRKK